MTFDGEEDDEGDHDDQDRSGSGRDDGNKYGDCGGSGDEDVDGSDNGEEDDGSGSMDKWMLGVL